MIKTHSDDPDVVDAANQALHIVQEVLSTLPHAAGYDYGGHQLTIGEYGVCERCTTPIAEAQAAEAALRARAEICSDQTIAEHLSLAADLLHTEATAAIIRAEFHNGHGTENILNSLLAYQYERGINEDYQHSHHRGVAERSTS